MRHKIIILIIVILTLLSIYTLYSVGAKAGSSDMKIMSSSEITKYIEEFEIIFLKEEPEKNAVQTFSLSPDGLIAIQTEKRGLDNIFGENYKNITVYDSDGNFRYGYSLNVRGSMALNWNDRNLDVIVTGVYLSLTFDPDGNVINVSEINSDGSTMQYINNLRSPKQAVDGVEYSKVSDIKLLALLADGSQKVIGTYPDGKTKVIYDSGILNPRGIAIFSFVIVFAVILFIVILKHLFKNRKIPNTKNDKEHQKVDQ